MEWKRSVEMSGNTAPLYWIYGEGDEENIYETIRKQKALPSCPVYDEVFEKGCPANMSPPPPPYYGNTCKDNHDKREDFDKLNGRNKRLALFLRIAAILLIAGIMWETGKQIGIHLFRNEMNDSLPQPTLEISTNNAPEMPTTIPEFLAHDSSEASSESPDPHYISEGWFKSVKTYNYNCSAYFEKVLTVIIQIVGKKCGNVTSCKAFVSHYQQSQADNAKFTFYIDEYGNIYRGRAWECQYMSGELWVAVMVDEVDKIHPEHELLLRHFTGDVLSYGKKYEYLCTCFKMQVLKFPM